MTTATITTQMILRSQTTHVGGRYGLESELAKVLVGNSLTGGSLSYVVLVKDIVRGREVKKDGMEQIVVFTSGKPKKLMFSNKLHTLSCHVNTSNSYTIFLSNKLLEGLFISLYLNCNLSFSLFCLCMRTRLASN